MNGESLRTEGGRGVNTREREREREGEMARAEGWPTTGPPTTDRALIAAAIAKKESSRSSMSVKMY